MSHAALLAALTLIVVLLHPLSQAGHGRWANTLLTAAVLLAAAFAAGETRTTRRIAGALVALALAGDLLVLSGVSGLVLGARAVDVLLLAFVTVVVLQHVMTQQRVSVDIILGSVNVYLLLGAAFFFAYSVLELTIPGAYQIGGASLDAAGGTERELGRFPILLYYSFVTLTTLGYGDVTPVHPISRSLATAEAVVGQLYLAVLVARLVGVHLSQRRVEG